MDPGTRMGDGMARRGLLRPLQNQWKIDILCIPCFSQNAIFYWFYKGLGRHRCAIPSPLRAQGCARALLKPIQNRSFCNARNATKCIFYWFYKGPEQTSAHHSVAHARAQVCSGLYKTNRKPMINGTLLQCTGCRNVNFVLVL